MANRKLMKQTVRILSLSLLMGVLSFAPLAAQTASPGEEATEKPKVRFLPPAYDAQMLRLSEILGALHYLRELCGANEGQLWRDQMSRLIAAEGPSEARKAKMIANFNNGFRGFREIYRECTPFAVAASNRYMKQGARLAGEIPDRYGR